MASTLNPPKMLMHEDKIGFYFELDGGPFIKLISSFDCLKFARGSRVIKIGPCFLNLEIKVPKKAHRVHEMEFLEFS